MSYELRLALYRAPLLFLAAFGLAFSGLLAPIAVLLAYALIDFIEGSLMPAFLTKRFAGVGRDLLSDYKHYLGVAIPGVLGILGQGLLF